MNLAGLFTQTSVQFDESLDGDQLLLNGSPATELATKRVGEVLDLIRQLAGIKSSAKVSSHNNFPMGSGIASSASAFAALSLAASRAAGLSLDPIALSRLARRGSGSACRSIPPGITEWHAGERDEDSYAEQLVPADYWDLIDCLAVTSEEHKRIGSTEGHRAAWTSPLQKLRINDANRRLDQCRQSILDRNFDVFAEVIEQDTNLMHSVMCTSRPELVYWTDVTLQVIQSVLDLRAQGIQAAYTIDAGPNVHVITRKISTEAVRHALESIPGVLRIVVAEVGQGAFVIEEPSIL